MNGKSKLLEFSKFKGHNSVNKSTANGTKYACQIFKEAMILTFD
jgi:hypothetical protein